MAGETRVENSYCSKMRIHLSTKKVLEMNHLKSLSAAVVVCILAVGIYSCKSDKNEDRAEVKDTLSLSYSVVSTFPHDITAFTQGLLIHDGKIMESTGSPDDLDSWIAEVDLGSGMQNKKLTLPSPHFGEGITIVNNKIYLLTWKSDVAFVYNASSYKRIGEFNYPASIKEGWGLTDNGEDLIMSDGTDKLYFLDTAAFTIKRKLQVKLGQSPIDNLNELEFVNGYIYANQWQTTYIYKIDPQDGKVVGRADLAGLYSESRAMNPNADVLNGIAYDANSKAFLVTGKYWPKAYLVRFN